MDDLETIKKYIKHYKLNLIEREDIDYTYTKRTESEIVTNKKFNKLLLESSMLRKMLKNTDIGKHVSGLSYLWACDYMNRTQSIHPPYFILQLDPKAREIVSYPGIPVTTWGDESIPIKPIQYERIILPFREYLIRDRGNTPFMDFDDSESYVIKSGGYTLIRRIIKQVVNVRKLFNGFNPVFIDMGFNVSFEHFERLYETKELDCELLPTRDEEVVENITVREGVENWRDLIIEHQRNHENDTPHNNLMNHFIRIEDVQED